MMTIEWLHSTQSCTSLEDINHLTDVVNNMTFNEYYTSAPVEARCMVTLSLGWTPSWQAAIPSVDPSCLWQALRACQIKSCLAYVEARAKHVSYRLSQIKDELYVIIVPGCVWIIMICSCHGYMCMLACMIFNAESKYTYRRQWAWLSSLKVS